MQVTQGDVERLPTSDGVHQQAIHGDIRPHYTLDVPTILEPRLGHSGRIQKSTDHLSGKKPTNWGIAHRFFERKLNIMVAPEIREIPI